MLFLHHIRRAITVAKSYDLVKKDVKENLVVLWWSASLFRCFYGLVKGWQEKLPLATLSPLLYPPDDIFSDPDERQRHAFTLQSLRATQDDKGTVGGTDPDLACRTRKHAPRRRDDWIPQNSASTCFLFSKSSEEPVSRAIYNGRKRKQQWLHFDTRSPFVAVSFALSFVCVAKTLCW